jgi:hypothetical protein
MGQSGGIDAIDAIDALWQSHFLARSLFPRMDEQLALSRQQAWAPPGFYGESPYGLIVMKAPITTHDVDLNNRVAHWLNENFVIRLYALLQTFGVAKIDDPEAPGYDHYRIVRRLRDKLAHGSAGHYHQKDAADRDALERLQRVCPGFVSPSDYEGRFDLSISDVLWPLVVGCREYAATVLGAPQPLNVLEPTPPGQGWTS